MKNLIFSTLIIYAFTTMPSQAIEVFETDADQSIIKVEGDSSLHAWELESRQMRGVVVMDGTPESGFTIKDIELKVPVKSLKSESEGLEKKAHEILKYKSHPEITFNMDETIESHQTPEGQRAIVSGVLTVAGRGKTVQVEGFYDVEKDVLHIFGDHKLKMSDFGIKPPRMLVFKTADKLRIIFNLTLKHRIRE